MKRTFFLAIAILCTAIFSQSFSMNVARSAAGGDSAAITTLIVNADVIVILVDNDEMPLQATGKDYFIEQIMIERNGDTVMISSKKNRNLKEKGVVYVPAGHLNHITINSSAHVKSLTTLQIPRLDILVNGTCKFSISNIGIINLIETYMYTVEQSSEVRYWPSKVFLNGRN